MAVNVCPAGRWYLGIRPQNTRFTLHPHRSNGGTDDIREEDIFFYPHCVIQEEMLQLLIATEINVALITDHVKTLRILKKYPDSLLFINVDHAWMNADGKSTSPAS